MAKEQRKEREQTNGERYRKQRDDQRSRKDAVEVGFEIL